jgi:hypothetical protein
MLEFRLRADAKRIALMGDAIRRECRRAGAGDEHATTVAHLAEELVRGAADVLVVLTVQSDATLLMVRDTRPQKPELGEARHRLLESGTTRWSTISGRDGRTIWADIARVAVEARVRSQITRVPAPV